MRHAGLLVALVAVAGCGADGSGISPDDLSEQSSELKNSGRLYPFPGTADKSKYVVTFHDFTGEQYCTGTILRRRWVITAYHCNVFPDDEVRFYSGYAYSGDSVRVASSTWNVAKVNPPLNTTGVASNGERWDIKLVRLKSDIPFFDQKYFGATIPPYYAAYDYADTWHGRGYMVGGAKSTATAGDLREVAARINLIDLVKYEVRLGPDQGSSTINQAEHGDSGGPFGAVEYYSQRFELMAVISAASGTQTMATYVGVAPVRDWINSTMNKVYLPPVRPSLTP